jgi:hypothetical protein
MKKSARVQHYLGFGLRDVGILQIFYSPAVIKRTIVDAFSETSLVEEVGGVDVFLYEEA